MIVICSRCRQNLKFGDFTLFFFLPTAEKCTEIRAAREAREFFLVYPTTFLFCGIVVAVSKGTLGDKSMRHVAGTSRPNNLPCVIG